MAYQVYVRFNFTDLLNSEPVRMTFATTKGLNEILDCKHATVLSVTNHEDKPWLAEPKEAPPAPPAQPVVNPGPNLIPTQPKGNSIIPRTMRNRVRGKDGITTSIAVLILDCVAEGDCTPAKLSRVYHNHKLRFNSFLYGLRLCSDVGYINEVNGKLELTNLCKEAMEQNHVSYGQMRDLRDGHRERLGRTYGFEQFVVQLRAHCE